MPLVNLQLKQLRTDGGTQIRSEMDAEHIARLSEVYANAKKQEELPPPPIAFHDGKDYWAVDGFHRLAGAADAGVKSVIVDVRQGTLRDAILWAVSPANPNRGPRGLPIRNEDKRRMVQLLLRDPEWVHWSDRQIAEQCGVSHPFVGDVRSDMFPEGSGSVSRSGRTFRRGGKTYKMKPPKRDDLAELKELLDERDGLLLQAAEACHELGDDRTAKAIGRAQQAAAAFRRRRLAG